MTGQVFRIKAKQARIGSKLGALTVKDLLVVRPPGSDGDGGRNLARGRDDGRADGVGENAAGKSTNGSGKHGCGCVDCDCLDQIGLFWLFP